VFSKTWSAWALAHLGGNAHIVHPTPVRLLALTADEWRVRGRLCVIALTIALALWMQGCAAPVQKPIEPPAAPPELPLEERAAQLLSQAIRFRTVNPPGDEKPLARHLRAVLRAEGIETRLIKTPRRDSRTSTSCPRCPSRTGATTPSPGPCATAR
jgi:hypothetical protein